MEPAKGKYIMVKMKKHTLYIALGLLALAAVVTTLLAIGGVVTLPGVSQPAIEQPAVLDPQPGITAAEVEQMIDALPEEITATASVEIFTARMAYRGLSAEEQSKVSNLARLEQAEQTLAALGSSDSSLTVVGVGSRVTFSGGAVYATSRGSEAARFFEGESICRVTFYAEGTAHPFHLVSEDGSGVYGWVDESAVHLD